MSAISQAQMKRLTAVHGWSGVVLGLLLFVVVFTGTVVVFSREIGRWSAGTTSSRAIEAPLDATIRGLAAKLPRFYLEDVGIWRNDAGQISAFFHGHTVNPATGKPGEYGTLFRVDAATGAVEQRHEGFVFERPEAYEGSALRHFLVDLHVQLYLPKPWGLIVTGILGLLMMAAAISGFLMHRHLIRDLFVAERPGGRLVSARDRHVLASSWSLPFAIVLAFTGSFFSFASTVSFPLLSQVAFGGDRQAMIRTLYEPPAAEDPSPVRPADLDAVRAAAVDRIGTPPVFVSISNYGRADSRITVWHAPGHGRLAFTKTVFDGGNGAFLGIKPTIGTKDSAGSALNGLMWPLHAGDFAGVFSKAVWVSLGATMCFVILTGLRLWVRRRSEERLWRGFGRAVTMVSHGLPVATLGAAWAYFPALSAGDPFFWTPFGFAATSVGVIALGLLTTDEVRLRRRYWTILTWACLLLPALRLACGGTSWAAAMEHGYGEVLSVDLLLLLAGGVMLWARNRGGRTHDASHPVAEPAE